MEDQMIGNLKADQVKGILEYLLDFAAIDQIAEDKKDAPKR